MQSPKIVASAALALFKEVCLCKESRRIKLKGISLFGGREEEYQRDIRERAVVSLARKSCSLVEEAEEIAT
jgi:hypothetical protein